MVQQIQVEIREIVSKSMGLKFRKCYHFQSAHQINLNPLKLLLKNRLAWCVRISCAESILLQMFSQIHINLAIWQLLKWKQISNHVVALSRFLYDNFNIRILFSSFWFKLQSIVGCSWIILIKKQLQNCAKLTGKGLQWSPTFSKVAALAISAAFS